MFPGEDGGVGGRLFSYQSICRIWSGRLHTKTILDNYEFYMHMDDDSSFKIDDKRLLLGWQIQTNLIFFMQ